MTTQTQTRRSIVKAYLVTVDHIWGTETLYVKHTSPVFAMQHAEDEMRDRHDGRGYIVTGATEVTL